MVLDNRTKEQRVIDEVVAAKLELDGPDADGWRSIVAEKREQLDGFVAASKRREDELLHKQAMERDEFSRAELNEQVGLQSTLDAYTEKLSKVAAKYAEAFDAVRAYYASVYPGDDPAVSIRKVLSGDAHAGANVETKIDDDGNLITRIRRGLHEMGGVEASEGSPEADMGLPGVELPEEAETASAPSKKPWPYSFSLRVLDAPGEDQDKG